MPCANRHSWAYESIEDLSMMGFENISFHSYPGSFPSDNSSAPQETHTDIDRGLRILQDLVTTSEEAISSMVNFSFTSTLRRAQD